jgi:hypothetical protein
MEEMEQRKEETEQQDYKVRSEVTPETTSDDDLTVHKQLMGTKRMKKQKVTKGNVQND